MTYPKSFGSDNHAGMHPAVLRAIADANPGNTVAYGADAWTEEASAGCARSSVLTRPSWY